MSGRWITVNDKMQRGYRYQLVAPRGRNFAEGFQPYFAPAEMLALGVFEGKYLNDCRGEFPKSWFAKARLSETADPAVNCFAIKSRLPLGEWSKRGWIIGDDPRGWFQWYCRYWMGRRDPQIDARQIKRWRAFARHAAQVRHNCESGDLSCRPRQRQALLQWCYDPFI